MPALQLEQVKTILASHREELKAQGVKSLAVFGSVARGEARPDSDVDLLVEFDRPVSLFDLGGLQQRLCELLGGIEVDLVMRANVFEELKKYIYADAIDVL